MMGEPVEQRAREPLRAEYGSPFLDWQVAGSAPSQEISR
jgi:hypothetical protein